MNSLGLQGATGLVGQSCLEILNESPSLLAGLTDIRLSASSASRGQTRVVRGKQVRVDSTAGAELILSALPVSMAANEIMPAAENGAWIVDVSPVFRLETDILLCVPEVNGDLLTKRLEDLKSGALLAPRSRIIASPSSSAIFLAMVLHPLGEMGRLLGINATHFLSASHAGRGGLEDFAQQEKDHHSNRELISRFSSHPLWDQCLPADIAYERAVEQEVQKILGQPRLPINSTAVRVPVTRGEAISLNLSFDRPVKLSEVRQVLQKAPGIVLQDRLEKGILPVYYTSPRIPLESARNARDVFVGRILQPQFNENGLNLWIVSDNLKKGAAWNALQITEILRKNL